MTDHDHCDRFAREILPQLEQAGIPLGQDEQTPPSEEHFSTCPDCRRARQAYEQLMTEFAAAGADLRPPDGWQRRVWATVEERRAAPRRRPWLWLVAPAALAAALAVFILRPPELEPATLTVRIESGTTVRRGDDAQPGDRMLIEATTGGARHAELRVYRNDRELVLRCADQPPCERRRDTLRASLDLEMIGTYQSALLFSDEPLSVAPGQGLDGDSATAMAAGARVELGSEIDVR